MMYAKPPQRSSLQTRVRNEVEARRLRGSESLFYYGC